MKTEQEIRNELKRYENLYTKRNCINPETFVNARIIEILKWVLDE